MATSEQIHSEFWASDPNIRRDLFAVKADERDFGGWCYVAVYFTAKQAHDKAREIRNDHTLGLNRLAKVVHPSQSVVSAYLAFGNTIR